MLVLFSDTDTDMTPEIAKEYGYRLISMPYSVDGRNIYPYVDFEKFDCHEFYEMLRTGTIPSTSALNEEEYINYFKPVFEAGDDILYVHFSRQMSGTFAAMDRAVARLKAEYPERSFYAIDTRGISILSLNVALEIGDMYKAGKSVEEMLKWAETEVDKFAVYYFADDLRFFARSGRVSGLAGTMGTLLGIRPIIYMGANGKMESIGKEKGRAKAVARLVKYAEELGDDVKGHRVLITCADAPELTEALVNGMREKFGDDLDITTLDVNPTIGSHCGPNSIGVCFHAIHR
ncbi:MAG: DegV family protein [Oscillospiraceae bacterium]|nr:DegV family protein [Oscillospiraceae bacterium]